MSWRDAFDDLGVGIGLRSKHYSDVLNERPAIDFFEALTENYLSTAGRPREVLKAVAETYPVVLHGVSLSIGSSDPLDERYLASLRALADEVKARWVTDHVCWTGVSQRNFHDLLPIPYTKAALRHVVDRIKAVQDYLGRRILLENPSSYLNFSGDVLPEYEWIAAMAEESDCGLLLDVNNVFVSAANHGFDPRRYIDTMPRQRVQQYHLAGHTLKEGYILDSHIGPVPDSVFELFRYALARIGARSTLIEWDEKIPPLETMLDECARAKAVIAAVTAGEGSEIA